MSDLVSIHCSAVRPELWMRVYASLEQNKVDFEIIYVGDVKPNFDLPPNFRFIYSKVKPAQCVQIGAMESQGNYIINIPDDAVFSSGSLDTMLEVMKNNDECKTIVTPTYYKMSKKLKCCRKDQDFTIEGSKEMVSLPACSFMSKKGFESIGGYDRGFVAIYYDVDLSFRLRAVGGQTIIVPEAHYIDSKPKGRVRLCNAFGKIDGETWYSDWCNDINNPALPAMLSARKRTFDPYDTSNFKRLVKISQGKVGHWTDE